MYNEYQNFLNRTTPQYNNMQPNNSYQQQFYNQNTAQQIQTPSIIEVNGLEGAKAYQMQPNSRVALFDLSNMALFIKITDGAGFPTITEFDINVKETKQIENTENTDNIILELKNKIVELEIRLEDYINEQSTNASTRENSSTNRGNRKSTVSPTTSNATT